MEGGGTHELRSSRSGDGLDVVSMRTLDRQAHCLGKETLYKLQHLKVLVVGLRGVGVETCKNLLLLGIDSLGVHDNTVCEQKDLGLTHFISTRDVAAGKQRAHAVLSHLDSLKQRPSCKVQVVSDLSDEAVLEHDALVITRFTPTSDLVRLDELCRNNRKSFYYCYTSGVNACIFVDHGDNHQIVSCDGMSPPVVKLIEHISPIAGKDECLVRYETPQRQLPIVIYDGYFLIEDVEGGCAEALNKKIFAVEHEKMRDPVGTVRLPVNIASMGKYQKGGVLIEQKSMPKPFPMRSLAKKIKMPGALVSTDLATFSERQQHLAFVATSTFAERRRKEGEGENRSYFPRLGSAEDAAAVVAIAKELLASKEIDLDELEADETLIANYALFASIELQPMAAFLGGVLAQEVAKCSLVIDSTLYHGKQSPIPGFMHFSSPELLPDEVPTDTAPRGHRNDELAAVYGWPFVLEKLGNLKYLIAGCGASGGELMKNFALNGLCCGPEGLLTVCDPEKIGQVHLPTSMLFRSEQVGQPKAAVAAGVICSAINADIKVAAHSVDVEDRVLDEAFWSSLSGACSTVGYAATANLIDYKSLTYEFPFVYAGMPEGLHAYIETICPFKTPSFGQGGKPVVEFSFPTNKLLVTPYFTYQCTQWAKELFVVLFASLGKQAKNFLADPTAFETKARSDFSDTNLKMLISYMRLVRKPTIEMAAQFAFDVFHFFYRDNILHLQANFPRDLEDEKGSPFWGGKRRYPCTFAYNPLDDAHTSFMISTTCLIAANLSIVEQKQPEVQEPRGKEQQCKPYPSIDWISSIVAFLIATSFFIASNLGIVEPQGEQWCKQYRNKAWINSIVASLTPPHTQMPLLNGNSKEENEAIRAAYFERLLDELREVAAAERGAAAAAAGGGGGGGGGGVEFQEASFDFDDDDNMHVDFVFAASRLRCDNFAIKRPADALVVKIESHMPATIITTSSLVSGLAMMEVIKLALDKPTEALLTRAFNTGSGEYKTVSQSPPTRHPEGYTVWDKIVVSGDLTMKQFEEWLVAEHSLKMQSWYFLHHTGLKKAKRDEEDDGDYRREEVVSHIYPPAVTLDYGLLPSLELTKAQAAVRLPSGPQKMKYLALWSKLKASGALVPPPTPPPAADATLRQMLQIMATKSNALLEGSFKLPSAAPSTSSSSASSSSTPPTPSFWVVLGCEGLLFEHAITGEEVEHCPSFKIILH